MDTALSPRELLAIHRQLDSEDIDDDATASFVASGTVALSLGNLQDAISLCQAAAACDPANARAWALLGEAHWRNRDVGAAREALEQAIRLDDDDLAAALLCARAQIATGATLTARALLQYVISRARGVVQRDADALLSSLPMNERGHA
jgi:Flp pilus assembly protein TadD